MNTNQKIDNRIKNIDILRGIAILLVVIFHYTSHYSPEYLLRSDNWSLDIAKYGWSGVDIFFVVSGFLMAFLYMDASPSRFFKSRIKRLLPAFFVTNLLFLTIGTLVLTPFEFVQLQNQVVSSAVFGNNFYFWTIES